MDPISRREFCGKSTLGAAALAGAFSGVTPLAAAEGNGQKIELAIATICCDGFGDENFKYSFEAIPQLGFKNVEFNVWYPHNLTLRGLESIQKRSRERNLKPICLQGSSFIGGNKDAILKDVTHKLWLMEGCKKLGCRVIKCTGGKRGTAGGIDDIIKIFKELAPAAEEYDVLLLAENHFQNNLEFPEDYEKLLSAVDSPNVGICVDPAHFMASGVDVSALIERFRSKVLHFDLKDLQRRGETKWAKFGEGIVDLHGLVQNLIRGGYSGYLVVELSLQDRTTMMADLRKGYEMFKRYETR